MTTTEQDLPATLGPPASSRRVTGRTALVGLALFAVSIGGFSPESSPDAGNATASAIRRYAIENANTIRVNTLTSLIGVGLFVFFAAGLAQQIRMVRQYSVAPTVLLCLSAMIATHTMSLTAVNAIFAVPGQLAQVSDDAVVTLYRIVAVAEWVYTLTLAAPCMLLVATYSWVSLRHKLMARGVAWAGVALAGVGLGTVVSISLPHSTVDLLVVVLFGWWLWPLVVGTALGVLWLRTR